MIIMNLSINVVSTALSPGEGTFSKRFTTMLRQALAMKVLIRAVKNYNLSPLTRGVVIRGKAATSNYMLHMTVEIISTIPINLYLQNRHKFTLSVATVL